jgi:hypothetical protein
LLLILSVVCWLDGSIAGTHCIFNNCDPVPATPNYFKSRLPCSENVFDFIQILTQLANFKFPNAARDERGKGKGKRERKIGNWH